MSQYTGLMHGSSGVFLNYPLLQPPPILLFLMTFRSVTLGKFALVEAVRISHWNTHRIIPAMTALLSLIPETAAQPQCNCPLCQTYLSPIYRLVPCPIHTEAEWMP